MADQGIEMTSRIDMSGTWYGQKGVKRGSTLFVPDEDAARNLELQGYAERGRVKLEDLGRAYWVDNPDALSAYRKVQAEKVRASAEWAAAQ
jgi:hypothetical protein